MPQQQLSLEEFAAQLHRLASLRPKRVGIGVTDPEVAAYARIFEYGSIAGHRPWPHPGEQTVTAVDPETGAQVVVSAQAPHGFIRVHVPAFRDRLQQEIKGSADWLDPDGLETHFTAALEAAATKTLEEIRAELPQRWNRLRQSLEIMKEQT